MSQIPLVLVLQSMLIVTYLQAKWHIYKHHDSFKANHKGQKVGSGPIPENSHVFPKIVGILLPLISLWNLVQSLSHVWGIPVPVSIMQKHGTDSDYEG